MAKPAKSKSSKSSKPIKVVKVKSRLARVALGPGGVTKSVAVGKASAAIDDMRQDYPHWLEHDLQKLQETIAVAHASDGADTDILEAIYRQSAQIRDLGESFGFPFVTAAADSLCELVFRLLANEVYDDKSIDCHVTALQYLKQPMAQTADNKETLPLVRGLKALVERYDRPEIADEDDPETSNSSA